MYSKFQMNESDVEDVEDFTCLVNIVSKALMMMYVVGKQEKRGEK